jgi:hypothetical protein
LDEYWPPGLPDSHRVEEKGQKGQKVSKSIKKVNRRPVFVWDKSGMRLKQ